MTECKRAYRIGNEYRRCGNTNAIRPVMWTARFYEKLCVFCFVTTISKKYSCIFLTFQQFRTMLPRTAVLHPTSVFCHVHNFSDFDVLKIL